MISCPYSAKALSRIISVFRYILDFSWKLLLVRHDKENQIFDLVIVSKDRYHTQSKLLTAGHLRAAATERTTVQWWLLEFSFQNFGDNLIIAFPSCNIIGEQFRIFSQQVLPVTGDIIHLQVIHNKLASPFSNFLSYIIICFYKLQQLLDIGEICFDWDIVNPWLQLWIEKFQPLITNMENKWTTQKEVFEPETCSYTPEIKQIPGKERAKYTW